MIEMRKCILCNGKGYTEKMKSPKEFDRLYDMYDNNTPASDDCYNKALIKSGGMIKELCSFCKGKVDIEFIEIEKYDELMHELNERGNRISILETKLFKMMENTMGELILSNKQDLIKTLESKGSLLDNYDIDRYFQNLFISKNLDLKHLTINIKNSQVDNIEIILSNGEKKHSEILCVIINEILKEINIVIDVIPF
jgi:hypothetical protein